MLLCASAAGWLINNRRARRGAGARI
jgi:hypothetical protein